MKVVISLGGSVLGFPPNVDWLRSFRSLVSEFRNDISAIVVGGGPLAREMINIAREFNVKKGVLDNIGIQATILNAWVVRAALDGIATDFVSNLYIPVPSTDRVPVFGGTIYPGLTTDFGAALIAENLGASFLNITRSGGLYDKDPERFPDATLLRRVTYREVEDIVFSSDQREPGTNFPIDLAAFHILKRSSIHTYIVGPDIENIRRLFRGEGWIGTEIVP